MKNLFFGGRILDRPEKVPKVCSRCKQQKPWKVFCKAWPIGINWKRKLKIVEFKQCDICRTEMASDLLEAMKDVNPLRWEEILATIGVGIHPSVARQIRQKYRFAERYKYHTL